jgi:hypothetical protein
MIVITVIQCSGSVGCWVNVILLNLKFEADMASLQTARHAQAWMPSSYMVEDIQQTIMSPHHEAVVLACGVADSKKNGLNTTLAQHALPTQLDVQNRLAGRLCGAQLIQLGWAGWKDVRMLQGSRSSGAPARSIKATCWFGQACTHAST